MEINIPEVKVPRIVIIGCGFGGLQLVKSLAKTDVQIVLLDKNNYFTFQPLLYQVATAGLEADSIAYPIRKIFEGQKNFHFRLGEVLEIRPRKHGDRASRGHRGGDLGSVVREREAVDRTLHRCRQGAARGGEDSVLVVVHARRVVECSVFGERGADRGVALGRDGLGVVSVGVDREDAAELSHARGERHAAGEGSVGPREGPDQQIGHAMRLDADVFRRDLEALVEHGDSAALQEIGLSAQLDAFG